MSFPPGSAAWLAALCSSRVLGATWFVAYSAVLPLTQAAWGLAWMTLGLGAMFGPLATWKLRNLR